MIMFIIILLLCASLAIRVVFVTLAFALTVLFWMACDVVSLIRKFSHRNKRPA